MPPYYHQADVWLEILDHFGWTKVTQNNIKVCSLIFVSSLKKSFHFFSCFRFSTVIRYSLISIVYFLFIEMKFCLLFFGIANFVRFLIFRILWYFDLLHPHFLLLLTLEMVSSFLHHIIRFGGKLLFSPLFFHYFDLILSKFEPIPLDIILLSYLFLCFDNRRCGTMWWTVRFFSIRFYVRSALFFVRIPINHIYL